MATKPRLVSPVDHYCDWDSPGGRVVRALCGALIRRVEHTNQPTCQLCQHILAERERDVTQSVEGV